MDIVDFLLQAWIFLTFVVFAVAVFSIKRDMIRKRREKEQCDVDEQDGWDIYNWFKQSYLQT